MADKKRHPLLAVFLIIIGIALFLGLVMAFAVKTFGPRSSLSFGEKIGVVFVEGPITHAMEITSQLEEFHKDKSIKAIVLRIDSPGGVVGPTQEIYREVEKTAEDKSVVASLGSVAASGGYYIAAAADKIVANPGTLTGSIGAIMEFVHIEELLKKIGINLEVLKSGEFKDIGSPHRKLTDRDKEVLEGLMAEIKKQFVEDIAKGRGLSQEKVEQIADGRIFSGTQAKDLHMVDYLGNFQDAVALAKEMEGLTGETTLVYPKRGKFEFWDLLFESATKTVFKLIKSLGQQMTYRWEGFSEKGFKEKD
jgi:protease-4